MHWRCTVWKEIYSEAWHYYEATWIEDGITIIFIKSINTNKYSVHVKGKWCKSYKYNYFESDIDVAKLKGLTRAKQEGWKVKSVTNDLNLKTGHIILNELD